jgi:hypothetical protein
MFTTLEVSCRIIRKLDFESPTKERQAFAASVIIVASADQRAFGERQFPTRSMTGILG